jgi:hypothetical protein
MSERTRSSIQNISCHRSQSCRDNRDKVTRKLKKINFFYILKIDFCWLETASELHRQTIDRAQRRFEKKLANSERELRRAVTQRRDHSSSPDEKRQATQHIQHLRSTLNNDYAQLIQVGELFFFSLSSH